MQYGLQLLALLDDPQFVRIWKRDVWAAFVEPNFFSTLNPSSLELWKPIIQAILETDSTAIDEILANLIPSSTASNMTHLFQSKDTEVITKKQYLRRLAFCIYSCPMDYFFILLPLIHERIVDLQKSKSLGVQAHVLVVIQFLVFRLSPGHITNLWPIILTELIRIIENCIVQFPVDLEERNLLLSSFRLIYVIIGLNLDDFQSHKWIFFSECSSDHGGRLQPLFTRLTSNFTTKLEHNTEFKDIDRRGILMDDNALKLYAQYLLLNSGKLDKLEYGSRIDFMDQIFIDRD